VIPLPHPSGANLWLNRAENQELVRQALGHITRQSRRLGLPTGRCGRATDPSVEGTAK
jgi:hypothetical protein